MGCPGCGGSTSQGNCKDCNKVSARSLPSNNPCDPNYTGDLIFDGSTFVCENGPGFTMTTNTAFNTILASIFTQICSIYAILDGTFNVNASSVVYDGDAFECPADVDLTLVPGTTTLDEFMLTTYQKLCAFSSNNNLYVGVFADQVITAGAGYTLIAGVTLTIPVNGDGDYMARVSLDMALLTTADVTVALFKNGIILADTSVPKNVTFSDTDPFRTCVAIIHKIEGLAEGDDVDVRVVALTANATVVTCNLELDQKA